MSNVKEKGEQIVYGVAKVSNKGQIIIPVDLRNELAIKQGDQLVVTKARDGEGILLLKLEVLDEILAKNLYLNE